MKHCVLLMKQWTGNCSKIWPTGEFQLISGELPATDIADIAKSFIQPFELDQAPLFRVELAVVSGKQYLMIDMHHIISDGVSMSLLLKEFTKLYKGNHSNHYGFSIRILPSGKMDIFDQVVRINKQLIGKTIPRKRSGSSSTL